MTLSTALYLADLLDNVHILIYALLFSGLTILSLAVFVWFLMHDEKQFPQVINKIIAKWWVLIMIAVLSVPIPSKSTVYLMLGATYLQQSALPSKVAQALELKLDDYIDELKGKK